MAGLPPRASEARMDRATAPETIPARAQDPEPDPARAQVRGQIRGQTPQDMKDIMGPTTTDKINH